jgi:hypothetical protein
MTARSLLDDLRAWGVRMTAEGDHLQLDGPDDVLTDEVIEAVTACKAEVLELLRLELVWAELTPTDRAHFAAELAAEDPLEAVEGDKHDLAAVMLASSEGQTELGTEPRLSAAWLLYSRHLQREIWLVRDGNALAIIADEIGNRPVFFGDELPRLRMKSLDELRAIADAKAIFGPGTRLASVEASTVLPP